MIRATERLYVATFKGGGRHLLNGEEVQRLLDAYPARLAGDSVIMRGANGVTVAIDPATRGGGPAFRKGER